MPLENFFPPGQELNESLSTRPSVLTAAHGLTAKVRIAVKTCVTQHLFLDGDRPLEQRGMPLGQPDPLGLALIEAEVAA